MTIQAVYMRTLSKKFLRKIHLKTHTGVAVQLTMVLISRNPQRHPFKVSSTSSINSATNTFKIAEAKLMVVPLKQILEKLSIADQHLANLGAKHGFTLKAKADQQSEHLATQ